MLFSPLYLLYGEDEDEPFEIYKTREKIHFDGICDESLWDNTNQIKAQMFRPNHGQDPSERTEIFVTFDDEYFYLAGRLHYTNGARIISTTKKRDAGIGGNDFFGIILDTFNDNESALGFETSPAGLRSDFAISNDAQVNLRTMPFNRSWNTFWDVRTTVKDSIWYVEMRIPFSSLRFQDDNGTVIMGMSIWRVIASNAEFSVFPLMTNDFGTLGIWKPSQAKKIILRGVHRTKPLYITPYVLTSVKQEAQYDENEAIYKKNNDYDLNAGLDLKYALTSNMTLDLTVNTDFAQVEVDDQMVNLTRFSLFLPEKRQFFLERASLFTIKTGYQDELFYSRRIGLYEGDIIPIWAGARLVGRTGKYDIGFMDMQTAPHEYYDEDTDSVESIKSTNFGVLRLRRQVFNPRSYLGGMITSKIDVDGMYNINTALDGIFNPFKNDYITINYVQTFDSDISINNDFVEHGKFSFNWENRSNVGFSYNIRLSRAGQYYNPEMGFELMEDFTRAFGSISYGWVYNEEEKKMLDQEIFSWIWENKRNSDFKTDIRKLSIGYSFSMKNGYRGRFSLTDSYDDLDEIFELSDDVFFPVGEYKYMSLEGSIATPSNKMVSLRLAGAIGTYYDGEMVTFGPTQVTIRPSSSVNLGIDYQYSLVNVEDRGQKFSAHLGRFKTEFTFTTKLSLSMFFQYSSIDKFGINNIRFRYNPKEGNDLYIVYNEEYNTHLMREIPKLPFSEIRSIILKYTYTFIVGNRKKQKKHVTNYRHN